MMTRIPHGVWHGIQNVDEDEAEFINFPTHRYIHDDPAQ